MTIAQPKCLDISNYFDDFCTLRSKYVLRAIALDFFLQMYTTLPPLTAFDDEVMWWKKFSQKCNRTRWYITKLISFVVKNPNERHKRMTNWPDLYSNSNQNCLSYLTRVKNRVLLNELIKFSKNQEQNTTKEYIKSHVDFDIPTYYSFVEFILNKTQQSILCCS